MRAQIIIDAIPADPGTRYNLEIWDYDRGDRVRPLFTLTWLTHDSMGVDQASMLALARHCAYVAYIRIGAELAELDAQAPRDLPGPQLP